MSARKPSNSGSSISATLPVKPPGTNNTFGSAGQVLKVAVAATGSPMSVKTCSLVFEIRWMSEGMTDSTVCGPTRSSMIIWG